MFTGNVVNPIADARIQANLSLSRLAGKLDVSRQYISRAEHGTYPSLNTNLIRFVAGELNVSIKEVIKRYNHFQSETRKSSAVEVNPGILHRRTNDLRNGSVIFTAWRGGYWPSITSFSNAFCLHPETVRAYEDEIREEMPNIIRDVLSKVNLIESDWTERPIRINTPVPLVPAQRASSGL